MKATPEQWHELERHSHSSQPWAPCILELRARVEALEAAAQKHIVETNSNIVALFTRVEALEAANSKPAPNDRQIRSSDITPPPELVEQWRNEWIYKAPGDNDELGFLALRGAQWGADQELEACCAWLPQMSPWSGKDLRKHRRPKPPSLKEQALKALDQAGKGLNESEWQQCSGTIRRALEALPE